MNVPPPPPAPAVPEPEEPLLPELPLPPPPPPPPPDEGELEETVSNMPIIGSFGILNEMLHFEEEAE